MAKITYTGKVGDLIRIPCKVNTDRWIFNGTNKEYRILGYLLGGKHTDNNDMRPYQYFGVRLAKDSSEHGYTSGYTATSYTPGYYRVEANENRYKKYIALQIAVGSTVEVANNKRSNINKWLNAISHPARGFWWWVLSILLAPVGIGLVMLVDDIYRLVLSFVRKSCLRKAKASFKKNGKVIMF